MATKKRTTKRKATPAQLKALAKGRAKLKAKTSRKRKPLSGTKKKTTGKKRKATPAQLKALAKGRAKLKANRAKAKPKRKK